MKKICTIYRSSKKEGMYLYVDKGEDLSRVPVPLLRQFGKPEHAMTLVLHPERKLGHADIKKVLAELDKNGFYLQLPPNAFDEQMQQVRVKNSKL